MYYAKSKTKNISKDDLANISEFLTFFSDFTLENSDYNIVFQDMLNHIKKSHSPNN